MFGIPSFFQTIAVGAALVAALTAYDRFIDDPAVAEKARSGYIAYADKAALEAQLTEYKRQVDGANKSILAFAQTLSELRTQETVEDAKAKQESEAYAKLRKEKGTECPLTDDIIEFLRK